MGEKTINIMDNIENRIIEKNTEILFQKSLISNIAVFLGSLLVVIILKKYFSNLTIPILWFICMIALSSMRMILLIFKHKKSAIIIKKYYFILTVLLGLGWSIIPFLPYTKFEFFPYIANIFIMFALISLGFQALFHDKFLMLFYILPLPVTLMVKLLILGGQFNFFIVIAIAFFITILILYAFRQHNDFNRLLRLQIENENLLNIEREAKLKAEEASRIKSQFLSTMSHEIRTPLNAIIGFIDILYNTDNKEKRREYLNIIKNSANSLLTILNDILDISKIESNKLEFDNKPFNLKEVLDEIVNFFQGVASEKKLILEVDLDENINRYYLGDAEKIHNAISNLMKNAVKFTENGKIGIKAKQLDLKDNIATIEIVVYDTGVGIPANLNKKIFEPFFQIDSSVTRKFGGTGVGLAIVDKIVKNYNGTIKVESKIKEGSKFIINFRLKVMENTTLFNDKNIKQKFYFKNVKILIAEDNAVNQILIKKILEDFKIEVKVASNGKEALKILAEDDFDVIIADWHMPEMDGVKMCEIIRNIELNGEVEKNFPESLKKLHNKHIPIIVLTAAVLEDEVNFLKEKGFDSYISKPVDKFSLINNISQFIDNKKIIIKDRLINFNYEFLNELTNGNVETINKLINSFKKTFFELNKKLAMAFEKKDFNEIKKHVSALKSVSASIRLVEIYDICNNIEINLNKENFLAIKHELNKLDEIEIYLKQHRGVE